MGSIKKFFSDWSVFEKSWLAFVLLFQIFMWNREGGGTFMLIMTVSGTFNLVFGAKGKIAGLYFAIIESALYSVKCYDIALYGEVMYNVLYSIPCSAIAIYMWRRNSADTGEVKFRTMTPKLVVITTVGTVAATLLYAKFLEWMGGSFAFMDSLTTVVAVIASALYVLRFSEQWLMWVIVNALSIAMWLMVYNQGGGEDLLVVIMKTVSLCTSSYGYWNWRKIAKRLQAEGK